MNDSDALTKALAANEQLTRQIEALAMSPRMKSFHEAMSGYSALAKQMEAMALPKFDHMISSAKQLSLLTPDYVSPLKKLELGDSFRSMALNSAQSIQALKDAVGAYDSQFRFFNQTDIVRLTDAFSSLKSSAWMTEFSAKHIDLQKQLASISSPMIQIQDSFKSIRAFGELAALGAAVHTIAPFDPAIVQGFRRDLGDWRDAIVDVSALVDDPVARVTVYKEQGFNEELTDFPAQGFNAALSMTHIKLGAVSDSLAPPPADFVPEYNTDAYQWLFVFERELRNFIIRRLAEAGSAGWDTRLPDGMLEKWKAKKNEAVDKGEKEQPLIHYADFTDYNEIILKQANWRDCFKSAFKREESIREGFNRLRPIRLITAHMRVLTHEEWLILNLEVRRILRAIGVSV